MFEPNMLTSIIVYLIEFYQWFKKESDKMITWPWHITLALKSSFFKVNLKKKIFGKIKKFSCFHTNFSKTIFLECHSPILKILYIKSTLLCYFLNMFHTFSSLYPSTIVFLLSQNYLFYYLTIASWQFLSPMFFSGHFLAIN